MSAWRAAAVLALCGAVATPAPAQPTGDAVRGARVFEDNCVFCHALDGDGQAPNLRGVVGRKAASLPGYDYTEALRASGLTWSAATLDTFLTGPGQMVPGTTMQARLPDAAQRADLIAYLASLGAGR